MKNPKNELMQFVAGMVMLVVGLFIFSQKVIVSSGWFGIGGGMVLGGVRINSGMIMIPFIAGIIWMFISGASFPSKVFTVLSVILIITSVILTTNIHLTTITMFEWVVILVLIFGGAGFVGKVLFADNKRQRDEKNGKSSYNNSTTYNNGSVEDELNNIRKNMK